MRFVCNPITCETCCGRIPQRVILAIMLHLALLNSYNLRVVLNVAIVEMVKPDETNTTVIACPQYKQITKERGGGKFEWPPETKFFVLCSFYAGYVVSHIPGGYLADRYGGRYVLAICLLLSALSNAIFPRFTQMGGWIMAVVLRGLLGIVQGPLLPTIASFVSHWIPAKDRMLLGGICYGGGNLGTITGSIITGYLINYFHGWPAAFYFWSAMAFVYISLHLLFVFSYPHTHPFISEEEVELINQSITVHRGFDTPWLEILTNRPFWANIFGQFGHNYIFFTMVTWLPTYLKDMLQYDVQENGVMNAVPFFALWLTSIVVSCTGNYLMSAMSFMRPHVFGIVFGTMSNMLSAAFILASVYAECNRELCLAFYITSMVFKAFYYMILPTNINQLSQHHGGMMFGISNAISAAGAIAGGAIIGHVVQKNTFNEWKIAFWIAFGVTVVTSVVYYLWSSDQRQPFDYDEYSKDTIVYSM